ncbi:MAG: glycosyltransferase [Beutenbergiaceae bacterium]
MTTVVVSAGTYHLPFHRLMDWVGQWYAGHSDLELIVQHGPSRPVSGAVNHALLPYQQLLQLCRAADAVVLQGGAGGVMDMNRLGIVPIVVPRVPTDDEVVDDHQLIFTAEMARLGIIHRATTLAQLTSLLDQAQAGTLQTQSQQLATAPGIGAFNSLDLPPPALQVSSTLRRLGATFGGIVRQRLRRSASGPHR